MWTWKLQGDLDLSESGSCVVAVFGILFIYEFMIGGRVFGKGVKFVGPSAEDVVE